MRENRFLGLKWPLGVVAAMVLAGCSGGGSDGSQPLYPSGGGGDSPPTVTPSPPANRAPTISGVPAVHVEEGETYRFQPTAVDPDGDPLKFTVVNPPAWTTFDAVNGQLSGTPPLGTAGVYEGITIAVSDGKATVSLPAFSITVSPPAMPVPPPPPSGQAELSWTAPTRNEDGSALTNLAGYTVRYGKSPGNLDQEIDVPGAGSTSIVIEDLSAGTWYFTVASYTNNGVSSVQAGPVYKTIG